MTPSQVPLRAKLAWKRRYNSLKRLGAVGSSDGGAQEWTMVVAVCPASWIDAELEAVEDLLTDAAYTEVEVLRNSALHVLGAGGKRLRPRLVLLAASAAGGRPELAHRVAAACELVHTATLVHDDVVDESDRRRGRVAVQFSIGNAASVLMGDFLVIRAFRLLAGNSRTRPLEILVDTISRMCEGEIVQLEHKRDIEAPLEAYERIIGAKTAMLLSTCGRLGAMGGFEVDRPGEDRVTEALADYGYSLGMAFQIQDDILDFLADEETLGKPVGGDLREGKLTAPGIFAFRRLRGGDRDELRRLYEGEQPLTRSDVHRAAELIERGDGFESARELALGHVRTALRALDRVPDGGARDALAVLAGRAVDRRA